MSHLQSPISPPIPHLRRQGAATQLIVDGRPFIMLAGEIHNSSSSNLAYMEQVWDKLAALHCNTALVPVSWELIEPEEGRYDFGLVDGLIEAARRRNLRLVPLWFGTWKNATATYVPGWVKTNLARFPRAQAIAGRNGNHLSALGTESCAADARAFAALMRHIRQIDGEDHTVIMVQVENETGILGAPRDHCSLAEAAFAAPVPAELTRYLQAHSEALVPELRAAWDAAATHSGAWAQVFGNVADEAFMAWHIGRYVDEVTAAGQAEYALPMYANAWLVQHEFQAPGQYPSGGPVSRMLNVWQCAAPHINLCAPDIYLPDFAGICKSYTQAGNALFIPEAHHDETAGAHGFYAVGQYDALGFSPFGIESMNAAETEVYTEANRLLADMMPLLCAAQGTGNMVGVLQGDELGGEVILGGYTLRIKFSQ
ncbi:MAG TPA: beta-galactosidase, partial [Anaerolineae bacterium]